MAVSMDIMSCLCVLLLIHVSQAFYLNRNVGYSEEPCGPTLRAYRRLGIPNLPMSPENPPNATTTARPQSGPGAQYAGQSIYQLSRWAMMSSFDAPDLPDLPLGMQVRVPMGQQGTVGGAPLNYAMGRSMECRCERAGECMPLSGAVQMTKYAHQCSKEFNLVCCCSSG